MLALYPLWRKARRVYSLTSRLPGTNRLGFQPSLALSERFCLLFILVKIITIHRHSTFSFIGQ
ncbi:MAG: hypothetical protein ABW170_07575 [Candidatus Thiodiazotropha sp. L084R]